MYLSQSHKRAFINHISPLVDLLQPTNTTSDSYYTIPLAKVTRSSVNLAPLGGEQEPEGEQVTECSPTPQESTSLEIYCATTF